MIAIVPARAGSTRIPGKNTRNLGGVPLLVWSVLAGQGAGLRVYVASDSEGYLSIGRRYGADGILRAPSGGFEPDFNWLEPAVLDLDEKPDFVCILRPTSPFRSSASILGAHKAILDEPEADSIRGITPDGTPYKKWWYDGEALITPLLDEDMLWLALNRGGQPRHSVPSQTLPQCWRQTAGLEILRPDVLTKYRNISGERILGFPLSGPEALDINTNEDWAYAEYLVREGKVKLP